MIRLPNLRGQPEARMIPIFVPETSFISPPDDTTSRYRWVPRSPLTTPRPAPLLVARCGRRRAAGTVVFWALAAIFLLMLVYVRPIDHDESQYVAATVLSGHLALYRDFDYLQTPLQPLLLAPLINALPFAPLICVRLCNAAMAWLAALLLGRLIETQMASKAWGRVAVCLLLMSDAFQFGASVARNDMLPFLCLCTGLSLLHRLEGVSGRRATLISVALGGIMAAGAAAKISYALPAIAIPLIEGATWRRRQSAYTMLGYSIGVAIVATWMLRVIMTAPEQAWFDILTFPSRAPVEWYRMTGQAFCLTLPGRLLAFLKFFSIGPAPVLVATLLIAGSRCRRASAFAPRFRRQCIGLLAAAMVAAIMPAPLWRQYLLPIYPPLLVLTVPNLRALRSERWWLGLTTAFTAAGATVPFVLLASAMRLGSPLMEFERQAAVLAGLLQRLHVTGPVSSIVPELVADARGFPDPRFAAGPFVFRTRNSLGRARLIIGVDQSDAAARLRITPPGAILTGGDAMTSGSAQLDAGMRQVARSSGFRAVARLPDGVSLWMVSASVQTGRDRHGGG